MSEVREFKKPEGLENDLEFINPKALLEADTLGVILEGTYVGTVANQFGAEDFKFQKEDGKTVVVNTCGSLKRQMNHVSEGEFVQLSYEGTAEMTKGAFAGKPAHQFTVLVA